MQILALSIVTLKYCFFYHNSKRIKKKKLEITVISDTRSLNKTDFVFASPNSINIDSKEFKHIFSSLVLTTTLGNVQKYFYLILQFINLKKKKHFFRVPI